MSDAAQVAICMGSDSDWPVMQAAGSALEDFGVTFDAMVLSAHRMPHEMVEFGSHAADRGYRVIIAGAGGAAHLPGMLSAKTRVPVLGVPMQSQALSGLDSLLSIVQMPKGVPVGTLAIGRAGAANAGLFAAAILATHDAALATRLDAWRAAQTDAVPEAPDAA